MNLKNYIGLTKASEIRELGKPLLDNTDIDEVNFGRTYKNAGLSFTTNPERMEWSIVSKKYKVARGCLSPTERQLKPGCYLSDHFVDTHPEQILLKQENQNCFSFYHNILIMNSTSEYNEVFEFATFNKNSSINEWYHSNMDILEKFINYLKVKTAHYWQQPEKYWLQIPDLMDGIGKARYRNDEGLILDKDIVKTKADFQYEKLTAREKECLYWLFYGKTVPEIALILNISKRTVEKFITNLKTKFDCCTLFQLGDALSKLRTKSILLEKFSLQAK